MDIDYFSTINVLLWICYKRYLLFMLKMGKLDKQLKKLDQFVTHIKKSIQDIKKIQFEDIKDIEKTKDKVIRTIWEFRDMFDFDFTKEDLENDELSDLIKLCEELIKEIEERYGLGDKNQNDQD